MYRKIMIGSLVQTDEFKRPPSKRKRNRNKKASKQTNKNKTNKQKTREGDVVEVVGWVGRGGGGKR